MDRPVKVEPETVANEDQPPPLALSSSSTGASGLTTQRFRNNSPFVGLARPCVRVLYEANGLAAIGQRVAGACSNCVPVQVLGQGSEARWDFETFWCSALSL